MNATTTNAVTAAVSAAAGTSPPHSRQMVALLPIQPRQPILHHHQQQQQHVPQTTQLNDHLVHGIKKNGGREIRREGSLKKRTRENQGVVGGRTK